MKTFLINVDICILISPAVSSLLNWQKYYYYEYIVVFKEKGDMYGVICSNSRAFNIGRIPQDRGIPVKIIAREISKSRYEHLKKLFEDK